MTARLQPHKTAAQLPTNLNAADMWGQLQCCQQKDLTGHDSHIGNPLAAHNVRYVLMKHTQLCTEQISKCGQASARVAAVVYMSIVHAWQNI